jgi:CO/xanthine dehydrogenase Mo-binding subunit
MATGITITELPLDPEHIWRMIQEQKKGRKFN